MTTTATTATTASAGTVPATAGWREWVGLPGLGIGRIKAKLDTGARTSALHALSSERYCEGGAPYVRLRVQPRQRDGGRVLVVETAIIDERFVTDSSGHRERRIVIASLLAVGGQSWPIEITVTNRDSLRFRMLLGRSAMQGRLLVDPDRSYLLGLPTTTFAHSLDDVDGLIDEVGGAPLVIKVLEGTQGLGVVLAETKNSAKSVIEAFMGLDANILVQQFIKEAAGCDLRCFVIGDKVVAAMQRVGAAGEFRSNLHRGGQASAVKISAAERATAVRAARTLGLNVCGVDLLRSAQGPVIMEVNSSPGLRGIEQVSGLDIAGLIIEFLERRERRGTTRTRGRG